MLTGSSVPLILRVRKLDWCLLILKWLLCSFVVHLTALHSAVRVLFKGQSLSLYLLHAAMGKWSRPY